MSIRQYVQIQPGEGTVGGALTLTGGVDQLAALETRLNGITIVNGLSTGSNATIWVYDSNQLVRTVPVEKGASIDIAVKSASVVYIEGTLNNVIYWIGVRQSD